MGTTKALLLVVALAPLGCQGGPPSSAPAPEPEDEVPVEPTAPSAPTWAPAEDAARSAQAAEARTALADALSARLMQAIQTEGAAQALGVCADEAAVLSGQVSEAHGVRMGRTSARLRQANNQAPDWARPHVERGDGQPLRLLSDDGVYAELTPIRTSPPCLLCHGEPEQLAPGVSAALALRYPDDEATGFAAGDLRGWFWVEVDPAPR